MSNDISTMYTKKKKMKTEKPDVKVITCGSARKKRL